MFLHMIMYTTTKMNDESRIFDTYTTMYYYCIALVVTFDLMAETYVFYYHSDHPATICIRGTDQTRCPFERSSLI